MTDNTDDIYTFTTDSSPGESTYEDTVEGAVTVFKAPIAEKEWYGLHMDDVLHGFVRMKFAAEGSVSAEQVADTLSEHAGPDVDAEPLLRQLEAGIDKDRAMARAGTGGRGEW